MITGRDVPAVRPGSIYPRQDPGASQQSLPLRPTLETAAFSPPHTPRFAPDENAHGEHCFAVGGDVIDVFISGRFGFFGRMHVLKLILVNIAAFGGIGFDSAHRFRLGHNGIIRLQSRSVNLLEG